MERSELTAWLRLLETPGLGLEGARRLLTEAGSVEKAAATRPEAPLELIEQTWAWLQADASHSVLTLGDPDYPPALLATADPPLLLYLAGRRELLARPSLAIVGSRSPTAQGRDNAEAFAQALAAGGLTIVSGLALGVDAAAHRGALREAASSIAVVGTGLDQIYPRRNKELGAALMREGLVISEYPLGYPVLPQNFPRRNRIIAGLTRGCLVVEAALQSGSLITARLASEAGREVFAIPGSIHSPQARGCHALIRQGAKLVETAQDVLEELPPLAGPAPGMPVPATEFPGEPGRVLAAMGYDPIGLDELQARTGWPAAELSGWLLELELAGAVARLAGQLFQRRAGA